MAGCGGRVPLAFRESLSEPLLNVRLQFVLGAGLSSRLIAWYGQGYGGWSHVDAILPDGSLLGARSDSIGGQLPGVRIRPQNYERWLRRTVVELPGTSGLVPSWVAWLKRQLGDPYDSEAIWGFIEGKQEHARGHWICSACQTEGLKVIEWLPRRGPVPSSRITPDALLQMCWARGAHLTDCGT